MIYFCQLTWDPFLDSLGPDVTEKLFLESFKPEAIEKSVVLKKKDYRGPVTFSAIIVLGPKVKSRVVFIGHFLC